MYVSKYYRSGEEVDERLKQGYLDDAIQEGFVGTLKEFWAMVLSITNKVDKKDGYGLSQNDFTDELKSRLENLVANAVTKVSQLENDLNFQTKEQVDQAISDLIDGSGEALDTLKELADALNNDPNFATNIINQLTNLQKDVTDEITRATTQENALEDKIKNLNIDLNNKITEILQQIQSTNTEVNAKLNDLDDQIVEVKASLQSQKAELQQSISDAKAEATNQITVEKERAIQAETTLQQGITDLTNKHNQDIIEVKASINDNKTYTDQEVAKVKTELSEKIDQETSNRQLADEQVKSEMLAQIQNAKDESKATIESIEKALQQEVSDRTLGDTNLTSSIAQEQQQRSNDDTALGHRIDDVSDRITREVETLNKNIQDSVTKIDESLDTKVDKVDGYGLSENDFTDELKAKLESIQEGSQLITKVSQLENDLGYQTEAQVKSAIESIIGSAPEVLDTLEELAKALGDDPNFVATITQKIAALTEQINEEIDDRTSGDTELKSELQATINKEIQDRTQGDTELKSEIQSEASARDTADKTLQSNIDKAIETLTSSINTVQTALTAADNALSARIDAQDSRINQNVENIQHNLELIQALQSRADEFKTNMDSLIAQYQELTQRVTTLESDLEKEIQDRTEADQAIRDDINARIDAEVAKLQSADKANQDAIEKEIQDRTDADTHLQTQITNLDQSFEDFKTNDFADHIEEYEALKTDYDSFKSDYSAFKQEVTQALTLQIV